MKQRLLIIGKVWPEPASSAAGSRMMQLIGLLMSDGYEVSFASTASETEFSEDPARLGLNKFRIELNNSSFDQFIKELDPSVVMFDRFTTEEQFGWRVAEHCPDALRILDTEDLHCLRAARQAALKEGRTFEEKDLLNDVSKREIASIYRCDLTLIISEFEMKLLDDFFKVPPFLLQYLPFLCEPLNSEQISQWPAFGERQHFISIGNFLHEPNWDATLTLKKEIWPLIRKQLPKAEVHVYGAYPSQKVFDLHDPKTGFLIKGRAEDVKAVMSHAKVCLAPLRFGAGLKGKLLDAMLNGTPGVTTMIGAEAMHDGFPWPGKIAVDAEEIAAAAVELYTSGSSWKQAQENIPVIINSVFPKEIHADSLLDALRQIRKDLHGRRLRNFTGNMLLHHSALSTRYMALWIEEKNKKQV